MSPTRTRVDLLWVSGRIERWIRFGWINDETSRDPIRRIVAFDPGTIFALVRWSANAYGTAESRIDILRAVLPGEPCSTVPHVHPGGAILLRLAGWPKVEATLLAIEQVEATDIAPEDVCPDHWRHVHNRLTTGLHPRSYTHARHAAWLKRREIGT
ncbi:DUF2840 domain-containing protein [Maribius pontilimi]|uniref:DUF2840 domain-containing protein n=1 Tax=Palleronia pontilimi TaxID=1964209 RepID=A0A934MIT9_9RHOB|nr:DUF2840 domain-containing protein [Palleronia pontilimi]